MLTENWTAIGEVRQMAMSDGRGVALTDETGGIQRGEAVARVLGTSDSDLIPHVHLMLKETVEFIREERFGVDEMMQMMGVPPPGTDQSGHGLSAIATGALFERPEFGGENQSMIPLAPPQALAEVIAWYATLFTRMETAGRLDLPGHLKYWLLLQGS